MAGMGNYRGKSKVNRTDWDSFKACANLRISAKQGAISHLTALPISKA